MNRLLRVSYDHEQGLRFHPSEGCPAFEVVTYLLEVETAPGVSRRFEIEQTEFDHVLSTYKQRFRPDDALSCYSYSTVLTPIAGAT